MTPAVIDRIAEHRAEKLAVAMRDFAELVMATEAGTDNVSAVEALRILGAADKTEADLTKAVNRIVQRRADALVAVELPELDVAAEAIEAEIRSTNASFNEAKEKYRDQISDILSRQADLLGRHQAAFAAQQRLLDTYDDTAILGTERLLDIERTALFRERKTLSDELAPSRGQIGRHFAKLSAAVRQSGWGRKSKVADDARTERDDFERGKVSPLRKRLAAIEKRIEVLNRELAELSKQKLEA